MNDQKSLAKDAKTESKEPVVAAVRRQQQILLVRQIPFMVSVNFVIALFIAGFLSIFVPLWLVLIWLAAMLAFSGYVFFVAENLRKRPLPEAVTGRTLGRAQYWSAGAGLLWASTLAFFPQEELARYEMFLVIVMVGLAAGYVNMLQPIPRLTGWFAGAILVPVVGRLILEGEPLHFTVAILTLIFFFTFISSSQRSYRQLVALVESSLELERSRLDLVDAIESIRDSFAIWRPDGTLELANERFNLWFGDKGRIEDVPTGGLDQMSGGVWLQSYVRPMSRGGHVSVHTDVTALKNRERELIAAKLQAEEANDAKSQFLANMSHELRTPLNAIMGFAEMMRKGVFGPLGTEKYRQYAGDIHDSAAHLLAVINDILNFSKIQSGERELSFERVNLPAVVDGVLDACARQDDGLDARRIDVQIDQNFGPLWADAGVLKQVLQNLVRNAIKFTPPSGHITIGARIDKSGQPRISVTDTGIGISREMIARICQPFQQAENAFERKFRGPGLGLSISQALVRLLGGELQLESEKGKGTRVDVVLPAALRLLDRPPAQAS